MEILGFFSVCNRLSYSTSVRTSCMKATKEKGSDAFASVNFPREAEFSETSNFSREIGEKIGQKRDGQHGVLQESS